jgi:hypothetical protein
MPNIYCISQDVNNGYDTYSHAVVVAESEDEARAIHPGNESGPGDVFVRRGVWCYRHVDRTFREYYNTSWSLPADVRVELVGVAGEGLKSGTVLCASFHAG